MLFINQEWKIETNGGVWLKSESASALDMQEAKTCHTAAKTTQQDKGRVGYMEFKEFPKISRLSRECVITEKIDGTNASIFIRENGEFLTGSRTRWITPQEDNYGFAKWAESNKDELLKLGVGHHFGEWWGNGVQRGYNLPKGEKRFSLFNTHRWTNALDLPKCCSVVPIITTGIFDTKLVDDAIKFLVENGSKASPGFMNPEGIVIYHKASNSLFKKTILKDEEWKGKQVFVDDKPRES